MKESVVRFYKYFHEKISGKVSISLTHSELSVVDKFVSIIDSSAGEIFLFKYMCFQFYYWNKLETKFGKHYPIGWIIGDKAFKRWKAEDHWKPYSTELSEVYGIKQSDLIKVDITGVNKIYPHEEDDKLRYYNTDKGLIFCMDYTAGFNPKSNACNFCKNKSDCINIMSVSLASLINSRLNYGV